jgi:hypothetical protein
MRSKLLGGAAALTLIAGTVLASAGPASARWHGGGFWPGAVAAGVIGGAFAAATSPLWAPGYYDYDRGYGYQPYGYNTYDYVQAPAAAPGDNVAYCEARFRSYDPATGSYLGFDGMRHPCP